VRPRADQGPSRATRSPASTRSRTGIPSSRPTGPAPSWRGGWLTKTAAQHERYDPEDALVETVRTLVEPQRLEHTKIEKNRHKMLACLRFRGGPPGRRGLAVREKPEKSVFQRGREHCYEVLS
jgi:hypothetical protein